MEQPKVLIVDDAEENIDILVNTLEEDYEIRVATNGRRALELARREKPDIILLDVMMPVMDGFQVCERLKAEETTKHIPVIFLTALSQHEEEARGLTLGAIDFIVKPFNPELVKVRVGNHVTLKFHQDHLEALVKERTRELEKTQEVTIKSMGTLAEYRDPETGGHINRTQLYMKLLVNQLKDHPNFSHYLTDEAIDLITRSAPLHDIGKVGVHDQILLKPDKLTPEEFEAMKLHTEYGKRVIEKAEFDLGTESFLRYAKEIAYTHHERWDGTGYPNGLKGVDIPIPGRVMAVADVYDALISKRVYKPPFPHAKAREIILESSETHLDPDIVEAFLAVEDQFIEVAKAHADFKEEIENLELEK